MEVARRLLIAGMTKLIVAGGETSAAVVKALELKSQRIGPEIELGCPMDLHSAADRALSGAEVREFRGREFLRKGAGDAPLKRYRSIQIATWILDRIGNCLDILATGTITLR